MKHKTSFIIIFFLLSAKQTVFSQYPLSREVKVVEQVSFNEIMVESVGIYKGIGKNDRKIKKDVKKQGLEKAILDSKRASVYFLLFNSNNSILQTDFEQSKFKEFSMFFFDINKIDEFISFEEKKLKKRISIDNGKGLKIVKRFIINTNVLKSELISKNIISEIEEVISKIGNPFLMVIPRKKEGEYNIDQSSSNELASHATAVIQNFLISNNYEVTVPDQSKVLGDINYIQSDVKFEDMAYQLALSIGSDIYIDFEGSLEDAGYNTKRYSINLRAYETTTARLLGSDTGYSQGRFSDHKVSVEEAVNDAISKILSKISLHWKKDLNNGIQYKLVISFADSKFEEKQIENMQFALMDIIDLVSVKSKENIITKKKLDYILWCDPDSYDRSTKVYRSIKSKFIKQYDTEFAEVNKKSINRKFISLKID